MARPGGAPRKASRSDRTGWPAPTRPRPPALPCSPRCAPASRRRCCGRPSWPCASCGPGGARSAASPRGKRRSAWASCWWSHRTRRTPGATWTSSGAGSRRTRKRAWRSSRPRDTPGAHEAVAAFRLRPEPSILVTVAMAYEGLDVPEVAVVAALTHIRSRPWLEQMVARATRVDPNAGPYERQRALVFHPDDPLFQRFRIRMETEQGTLARPPKSGRKQTNLPFWVLEQLPPARDGIIPLQSNALALRFTTLRPGPDLA